MSVAMKTARIKFCGGCNPEYDRMAVAERIRGQIKDAGYTVLDGKGETELLIVICGCACACAGVDGFTCQRKIVLTKPPQDEAIIVSPPGRNDDNQAVPSD